MNFIKNLFKAKDEPVKSYADFWAWFQKNEKDFLAVVKNRKEIEMRFFDKLSPKLDELRKGYYFLTGMLDNDTVELVLTADGSVKNIVFVEELVEAAPEISGWKFTALKPAIDIKDVNIELGGYKFNDKTLWFYPNDLTGYPDEIDITIVHNDLTSENKKPIVNGIYIFLDNYLGELEFVNEIDNLKTVGSKEAQKEIIPIDKLKDYLTWRHKEFVEKYEGVRYNTANDTCSFLEAESKSGNALIATINTELLNWERKASHPWISVLTLKYDGRNNNGMPNKNDYKLLDVIQEEIMPDLEDSDGYLNIGRQTVNGERTIYFACKDFRKPSKVFFKLQRKYSGKFEIDFDIYKDKYWQSFQRFQLGK